MSTNIAMYDFRVIIKVTTKDTLRHTNSRNRPCLALRGINKSSPYGHEVDFVLFDKAALAAEKAISEGDTVKLLGFIHTDKIRGKYSFRVTRFFLEEGSSLEQVPTTHDYVVT